MIDVTPLAKAVEQLSSAIQEQALEPQRFLLRAGLIQVFEYTYELSWKMLKRYLQATEPNPDSVSELSFEGLFRRAYELGLVASPVAVWREFRQARTDTSHTYNEEKAISVVSQIPKFAEEVQYLVSRLQERTQLHA
jgi:nucleotidyltransferase substrate binding protein (TIGR01987 family)